MRRIPGLIALLAAVLALVGGIAAIQSRLATCAPVPLLGENLLPNASLNRTDSSALLPDGWAAQAPGAQLRGPGVDGEGFDYNQDGRTLQLIGIANWIEMPAVPVTTGQRYCATVRALTDSELQSTTRIRLGFLWFDAGGQLLASDQSTWQPVVLWTSSTPDWSLIRGASVAPAKAATLRVQIAPASDDRIYLDTPRLQAGGTPPPPTTAPTQTAVTLGPWPAGATGALSLSFDWETTMGGLIHSRSVDDAMVDQDPVARGLRMREGVTTTLELFRPHQIHATYFANGYNFLLGNTERRAFVGNPTYTWARQEKPFLWRSDRWTQTPWFANDPYGTVQSDPAWYFGDLVTPLVQAGQDIQSHTFGHIYAGFASPAELAVDTAEWQTIAGERGVAPAQALAFPWSGSAGMSDASWRVLEQAGITAVTRTNRSQRQYQLVRAEDVSCRPVPGHEAILACADFYLTTESEAQALALIDRAITQGGMIDLWAHTEEVTSAEQMATWRAVVEHAARRQAEGSLWIAPLLEIASWQQARAKVQITPSDAQGADLAVTVRNASTMQLDRLTINAPFAVAQATVDGKTDTVQITNGAVVIDLPAGEDVIVQMWK
jgi:peptidoglycan/xylan/chitin deacetylase (PgdA/CDA1 family)